MLSSAYPLNGLPGGNSTVWTTAFKLRFINRERTEDCSPLMVSGQVSDESLTFLGVYVSQQAVLRNLGLIWMT